MPQAAASQFIAHVSGAHAMTTSRSVVKAWDTASSFIQHLHGDALTWFGIVIAIVLSVVLAALSPAYTNWWNARREQGRQPSAAHVPLAAVTSAIAATADDPWSATDLLDELATVVAVIEAATPKLRRVAAGSARTSSSTPRGKRGARSRHRRRR